MKVSIDPMINAPNNNRRNNSFRGIAEQSSMESIFRSPSALFWLLLHGLCCIISLVLGFRFSRLIFFLLFTTSYNNSSSSYSQSPLLLHQSTSTSPPVLTTNAPTTPLPHANHSGSSRVVVGRHGIRIRPWPHPDPKQVMQAHRIMERVQREQMLTYGVKNRRPVIVITPTYLRTFQTVHLTGLIHTLMLVPGEVLWIVVEAGGASDETADLLVKSGLEFVHVGFGEKMPPSWEAIHKMEARMRLQGLRVVRERKLDGIVVFADDSNMHCLQLFDEIQSVKWMGALSIGLLAHGGSRTKQDGNGGEEDANFPLPVQGPACNSSGKLAGWHTYNVSPYMEQSSTLVHDGATVLPTKLEWAGFVMNSRLVWKDVEDRPGWFRDLDELNENGDAIETPLSLLRDESFVEPLGKCGREVMLWWLRVEARADSKFPSRWIIDPPLEIVVPAKRTPWPDAPPELLSSERESGIRDHAEKHHTKAGRVSRSRRVSHNKRKHDSQQAESQLSVVSTKQER
ncbi:hypothetical protein AMTRI_Chr13g121630 [Amborella trichopoda]|uniref:Glycosyltransferases n=1 Tax=Amborella trichopoda TaxID=13333 RepID=W1PWC1_AMBTC|nr:probable beta-1,4-xylosyltransferase IRX14H [Amborella trichopoda]XP_011625604.1 probable beta-1,4-xylosyltransferase IRX14H [Amborella trichopoda]XP_020526656.1 probable beta-1,4-xylosyltransferase IRX14H [Amborella trichopoda]XP_020526657.1 probable beta-1,4-xylosyltransferase IRX14H [Amborella trichopoda]XP_020526658.1 probable beta-1,4-xylosyltransferase IRX14H [Amborella trichopoda]ERN12056.1 hypothetical protein AMTR_s00035p00158100 [Amborella trichopoda]|eukprot:XP_006850475.1 probable beta-1,4-xylosyltransferase IRX14H [Amborella trichopoda]